MTTHIDTTFTITDVDGDVVEVSINKAPAGTEHYEYVAYIGETVLHIPVTDLLDLASYIYASIED